MGRGEGNKPYHRLVLSFLLLHLKGVDGHPLDSGGQCQ